MAVPSNTFIATWLAVTHAGATPVPVEPDPATHSITAEGVEAAITPSTKAIMPVHLYGHPADIDGIVALGRKRGIPVIEDAAQAQGARYRARRAGQLANAAGFSFYPGKNLGAMGDAGAITTDDDALAERVRMLRNYGSRVKYHHDLPGLNSRLDSLQAGVLRIKLQHLDEWNERRRAVAELYVRRLDDIEGLVLPVAPDWAEPVWHLFVVRHPQRDALQERLSDAGVDTMIHYPIPPHLTGAYTAAFEGVRLPVAERLATRCCRCRWARTSRSRMQRGWPSPYAMPSERSRRALSHELDGPRSILAKPKHVVTASSSTVKRATRVHLGQPRGAPHAAGRNRA